MTMSNTTTRYGAVTKSFHWLTALLILTLIGLGIFASDLPHDTAQQVARKAWLFSLHKTLGVTVFLVALLRMLWAVTQAKPRLLNAEHKLESWLAETVHWVLYAALVIVPLAGWIGHAAASGFAPIWWPFGQGLPLVPKDTGVEHAFVTLHQIAGKVLIGAVVLHVAGALKHHFIDRDATLLRMLPGTPVIGPVPNLRQGHASIVAAVAIWVGAIALGLGLGLGETQSTQAATPPALEQVTSDWEVQSGDISLTVVQFGSEVTGNFADWTAAIQFDDDIPTGKAGSVTATVSIPSLTLGSVTDQAKGPDFLDATTHPTAVFKADILHDVENYLARGTLTIKGNTVPVTLPFALSIKDGIAEMRGLVALDRRDFGVGDNMADEQNLGFEVMIKLTLRATRAE